MNNPIIEKTQQLGELIVQSQEFTDYTNLRAEKDADQTLTNLIQSYNLTRLSLTNEMDAAEPDRERVAELQAALSRAQDQIMENGMYKRYTAAETAFRDQIAMINAVLAHYIDPEGASGCSGDDCASCGCGCGH